MNKHDLDTVFLDMTGICGDCGRFGYINDGPFPACAKCWIEDADKYYEDYTFMNRVVEIGDSER